MGGLNYVVGRYNETRTWLTKPMGNFTFPNGFCASLGGSSRKLMYDITWVGRHMTRNGGGVQPINGMYGERELKWRMNSFNVGFGVALGQTRKLRVNLGLSFDFGYERVFTRVGENGVFNPAEFEEIQKNLLVGSSIFVQIILSTENLPGGIFIRPYVQFPYLKTDIYRVNEWINPTTYFNDPVDNDTYSWNTGVQLAIGLFRRRSD